MDPTSTPTPAQAHRLAEIRGAVADVGIEHFKLILIVGGRSANRSDFLRQYAELDGLKLLNVGKSLSEALLEISAPYRPASVEECFQTLIDGAQTGPVCLDRLEVLFEASLRLNPVELLKSTSRHRVLIASWPGTWDGDQLIFGPDGHPANRKVSVDQIEYRLLELHS